MLLLMPDIIGDIVACASTAYSDHLLLLLLADIMPGWGMTFDPVDFTKFRGYECPANTYGELWGGMVT